MRGPYLAAWHGIALADDCSDGSEERHRLKTAAVILEPENTMQHSHGSSGFTREHENENHSLGWRSGMELWEYIFMPDQGMWRGYPKGHPAYQAYGKSFEELQLKLHQLHPDLSRPISSSVCSDTALLYWDWQRRIP